MPTPNPHSNLLIYSSQLIAFYSFNEDEFKAALEASPLEGAEGCLSVQDARNLYYKTVKHSALIFIKPHANTAATQEYVSAKLAEKGLSILEQGNISGVDIDAEGAAIASLIQSLSGSVRKPGTRGAPVPLPGDGSTSKM